MSKNYQKIYYINGKTFKEAQNKKAYNFAKKYAEENGLDKNKIYELSNNSELAYLQELLRREDIYEIKSHEEVCLVGEFRNSNDDVIPNYMFQISFSYREKATNKAHIVYIADSVYSLTKNLVLSKTLYDYSRKEQGYYLEIYYLEDDKWVEWKIQDIAPFVKEKKEQHKKLLAQKRAIRDRQKYDRLLRLRSEGKITERQSKELYRLEKVFGG